MDFSFLVLQLVVGPGFPSGVMYSVSFIPPSAMANIKPSAWRDEKIPRSSGVLDAPTLGKRKPPGLYAPHFIPSGSNLTIVALISRELSESTSYFSSVTSSCVANNIMFLSRIQQSTILKPFRIVPHFSFSNISNFMAIKLCLQFLVLLDFHLYF